MSWSFVFGISCFFAAVYCTAAAMPRRCPSPGQMEAKINDYTYIPGLGAYKVYPRAASFNDARKICQKEGAHMAVINSYAEAKHLAMLAKNAKPHPGSANDNYVRMGFHDLFHDTEYVNINGESLQTAGYDNWDVNQPQKGDEECGAIDVYSGKLHDVSCSRPFGFICELPCVSTDDLLSLSMCSIV